MDFKERRFSIDPGKGKKMDGCPYSVFEDGRDVKDYIIPPKGYIFKGFRFDPDASNQIYDGKLIAEYEKESFNDLLKSNLWKVLLPVLIIVVIGGVVLLALSVFKDPKPKPTTKEPTPTKVVADTTTARTDSIATVKPEEKVAEADTAVKPVEETQPQDEPQPMADDPNVKFKNDFWELVHQRTIQMDPYDALYKDNKDKASGEEFDYLRFNILKNSAAFKEWTKNLRRVPTSDLQKVESVNDLVKKLDEYK